MLYMHFKIYMYIIYIYICILKKKVYIKFGDTKLLHGKSRDKECMT